MKIFLFIWMNTSKMSKKIIFSANIGQLEKKKSGGLIRNCNQVKLFKNLRNLMSLLQSQIPPQDLFRKREIRDDWNSPLMNSKVKNNFAFLIEVESDFQISFSLDQKAWWNHVFSPQTLDSNDLTFTEKLIHSQREFFSEQIESQFRILKSVVRPRSVQDEKVTQ